ncbi:MAG: YihY/virulence factor BrkB family protein [Parvibaculum sp.]
MPLHKPASRTSIAAMFANPIFLRLRALVWETRRKNLSFWQLALLQAAQITWVVIRDLIDGRLNLRAMSLVYTTLLSLVPTIAIAFAIFRAFGYAVYVQDFLTQFLQPLGEQGTEITARLMEFVERVNANVLGTVGFVFLIYTVISMVKKIEAAFNDIWHVEASRSLTRQVTEIVSMGVLGPVILFTAIGVMAGALSNAYVGTVIDFGPIRFLIGQMSKIVPYVILISVFALLYLMMPNTRVKLSSAFAGALVAGIAWGIAGWGFATFVVKSAQYVAVYSAFASLVVFMIWLYAAWLILLVGCSISFYFQKRQHLSPSIGLARLTQRQFNRMAIMALVLIHKAYENGGDAWTEETLAARLHLPAEAMNEIEAMLTTSGLIARSDGSPTRLIPALPARLVRISDVVDMIRASREIGSIADQNLSRLPAVDDFFATLTKAERDLMDGATIADLLKEMREDSQDKTADMNVVPPVGESIDG